MENEIKNQEATAAPAQAETTPQAETPAPEQGMKKINIEKFSPRMLMELDACTRCGECSNWCPAYDQDSREPLTPRGRARLFQGHHIPAVRRLQRRQLSRKAVR